MLFWGRAGRHRAPTCRPCRRGPGTPAPSAAGRGRRRWSPARWRAPARGIGGIGGVAVLAGGVGGAGAGNKRSRAWRGGATWRALAAQGVSWGQAGAHLVAVVGPVAEHVLQQQAVVLVHRVAAVAVGDHLGTDARGRGRGAVCRLRAACCVLCAVCRAAQGGPGRPSPAQPSPARPSPAQPQPRPGCSPEYSPLPHPTPAPHLQHLHRLHEAPVRNVDGRLALVLQVVAHLRWWWWWVQGEVWVGAGAVWAGGMGGRQQGRSRQLAARRLPQLGSSSCATLPPAPAPAAARSAPHSRARW